MKTFDYLLLLFFAVNFWDCKTENLCTNDSKIFEVEELTPRIKIENGNTREQIIEKFEEKFEGDICYKDLVFGLQLSDKVIKTNFKLNCPIKTSRIPLRPELEVMVNQKGEALLNNTFLLAIDSIDHWILNNFPLKKEHDFYNKEISIVWNTFTPSKYFAAAVIEITDGFRLKLDFIAKKKFDLPFCFLNDEEKNHVKKEFPYKFVLDLGPISPPPPPPSK